MNVKCFEHANALPILGDPLFTPNLGPQMVCLVQLAGKQRWMPNMTHCSRHLTSPVKEEGTGFKHQRIAPLASEFEKAKKCLSPDLGGLGWAGESNISHPLGLNHIFLLVDSLIPDWPLGRKPILGQAFLTNGKYRIANLTLPYQSLIGVMVRFWSGCYQTMWTLR